MEQIDYSVIIRTIGKAGEKYRSLLASVEALEPRPAEVIVVLPESYDLPEDRLGWETFCFSPKGMVVQRTEGIAQCKTRYALICDDDVCFGSDFVQKLYAPVRDGLCSFSAGPLYSFLPPKGMRALFCALTGAAAPTLFHRKDRYVSILKTTGYSYNRHLKNGRYYEAQSVAWTCFFADVQALRRLDIGSETWLDSHGYSALDDQTMFYKGWLNGMKTVIVPDALYEHMDAKTSTRNNKPAVLYSASYNRIVFWHRFIYSAQKGPLGRAAARAALRYRLCWQWIYESVSRLSGKLSREDRRTLRKGVSDGFDYVKSDEYRKLVNALGGLK